MKTNFFLVLAATLATSVWADQPAVSTPAGAGNPAATTPPPRASASRQSAPEIRSEPLVPGPATVSVSPSSRVNVRGRAGLIGEVITRLTNGEPVTVIEEVTLRRSGPDEPSAWAKIALPDKADVWVHSSYIDPTTKAVIPRRLNLRGGPGENYSVMGRIERGTVVTPIQTQGAWMEIEAPENAYAFIAAQYLKQEPSAASQPQMEPAPEVAVPTEPAPEPVSVPEGPSVASAPTEAPAETPTLAEPAPTIAVQPEPEPAPEIEEPPPVRIVQREGTVRGTFSIQAPTRYELISPETRRPINYLHSPTPMLDLSRYKGLRIIVTGEESLDERWQNTPIITIQRIQVLE